MASKVEVMGYKEGSGDGGHIKGDWGTGSSTGLEVLVRLTTEAQRLVRGEW